MTFNYVRLFIYLLEIFHVWPIRLHTFIFIGDISDFCVHTGQTGPGEPSDDGTMNKMPLPFRPGYKTRS